MQQKHAVWLSLSLRPKRWGMQAALWGLAVAAALWLSANAVELLLQGTADTVNSADYTVAQELYPLQTTPPYTVALDAGHGGMDSGTEALVDEVDVCEKTVDILFNLLDSDPNYRPMRTRPNGVDRSTTDRAQTATDSRASLLLSVHANCDRSTRQSHGFECYPTPPGRTYSDESMRFAQCLAQGMSAAGHRLHGETGIRFAYYYGKTKKIIPSSDTRVRRQKSFGMVEKPKCPAVLAEQCFLTNYHDVEQWASEEGCARAAKVYYEAICAYFGTQPLTEQP